MKPYVTYGIGVTVAGALLTFALYFLGAHNDVEKMQATSTVAGILAGFVIPVVATFLTLRAAAPDGGMSYGQGVLTALLLGVVAGVLGAVFNYIYGAIINPGMFDTIHEMQVAALEAQGKMTAEQIDQAAEMMKKFSGPIFTSIAALIGSPIFYTIIGLVVSIFVRRAPVMPA
jgi:membrane protein DedA with SNARE-associated domain